MLLTRGKGRRSARELIHLHLILLLPAGLSEGMWAAAAVSDPTEPHGRDPSAGPHGGVLTPLALCLDVISKSTAALTMLSGTDPPAE